MRHQVARFVGSDRSRDDGAGHTTGAAESGLAGDVHIRHVLVLSEQRQMEENRERRGVGGKYDNLRSSAVECLGGYDKLETTVG